MAIKAGKYTRTSDEVKTSQSDLIKNVSYHLNWEESVQLYEPLYELANILAEIKALKRQYLYF